MLTLSIVGQSTLAAATRECCARHFTVWPTPRLESQVLWICYDTPIGADDRPDADWVVERIYQHVVGLPVRPLILISSQLPVGTTARLEKFFPDHSFAYSPENIRVASGVADFEHQARVIIGIRTMKFDDVLEELFAPFTDNVIMTTPETAECCKHFLNTFLALNIVFANEMARICAAVGANAQHVSEGLRCEPRISPKAPLRPGAPYGGGHLARDVFVLNELAAKHGISVPVIAHLKESNEVGTQVQPMGTESA